MMPILRWLLAMMVLTLPFIGVASASTEPIDQRDVAIMKGHAVGVTVITNSNLVRLQFRTVKTYGADVLNFMDWPDVSWNNIATSWDATPLLTVDDEPWCKRVEAMMPEGIQFGEMWIIAVRWGDGVLGQEIMEIVPFDQTTEREMTARYREAIRDRELRSARMPIQTPLMHCKTLQRTMQIHIAEAREFGVHKEKEYWIEQVQNMQAGAASTLEQAERRTDQWIAHLRTRLAATDEQDTDEQEHIRKQIEIASTALDELRSIVDDIVSLNAAEHLRDE